MGARTDSRQRGNRSRIRRSVVPPRSGALGSPLDHRAVGERVGKGNAQFNHVHARAVQGDEQFARGFERGIARREVHDQSLRLPLAQLAETGFDASYRTCWHDAKLPQVGSNKAQEPQKIRQGVPNILAFAHASR